MPDIFSLFSINCLNVITNTLNKWNSQLCPLHYIILNVYKKDCTKMIIPSFMIKYSLRTFIKKEIIMFLHIRKYCMSSIRDIYRYWIEKKTIFLFFRFDVIQCGDTENWLKRDKQLQTQFFIVPLLNLDQDIVLFSFKSKCWHFTIHHVPLFSMWVKLLSLSVLFLLLL